jgi:hypothetical protein
VVQTDEKYFFEQPGFESWFQKFCGWSKKQKGFLKKIFGGPKSMDM